MIDFDQNFRPKGGEFEKKSRKMSNAPHLPRPPSFPLGLNIDRCIKSISFVIHGITHFTFMLLIYVSFNLKDILHNKCNSLAFYRRFQSNYFGEKHKLPPKLP